MPSVSSTSLLALINSGRLKPVIRSEYGRFGARMPSVRRFGRMSTYGAKRTLGRPGSNDRLWGEADIGRWVILSRDQQQGSSLQSIPCILFAGLDPHSISGH